MTSVDLTAMPHRLRPWSAVVRSYTIETETVASDSNSERVLFDLDLELSDPLPKDLEDPLPEDPLKAPEYHLCLSWPLGGIWKIRRWSNDRKSVHCQSWRTTNTLKQHKPQKKTSMSPSNVFGWKMQVCKWKNDDAHWIVSDIRSPTFSGRVLRGHPEELMTTEELEKAPLQAQLLVNFAPLQVQIKVNNITSVDTVNQNFSADVTWTVTIPAITAMRKNSVVREMIDTLEIDPKQFGFANASSIVTEHPLITTLSLAGEAMFTDPAMSWTGQASSHSMGSVKLHHLQFSRRVIAIFSEEMSMYYFPFDQHKLSFDFSIGGGVRPWTRMTPASVEVGNFDFENLMLGNVFDAVFEDKVFVSGLDSTGMEKHITFELMLERKSRYYMDNMAISAALITYLCFIAYAPLLDGRLMSMDARLQIVITLLLTLVAFKSQVSTLTSQVTWMDNYMFCCIVVTCVVALENAMFPTIQGWFPNVPMSEDNLLGISFGLFSFVNVLWGLYIVNFRRRRSYAAKVILEIHEISRVVSRRIPGLHREQTLHSTIDSLKFPVWAIPPLSASQNGDVFVELPDDSPHDTNKKMRLLKLFHRRAANQQAAEEKSALVDIIYETLNSSAQEPPTHAAISPSVLETGNIRTPSRDLLSVKSTMSDTGGVYQRMP